MITTRLEHFSQMVRLRLLQEKKNWISQLICHISKKAILALSMIVVLLTLPVSGRATTGYEGVSIVPSLSHFTSSFKNNDTNETNELTKTCASIRLGVTLEGGFYLGAVYDSYATDQEDNPSHGSNSGASIGFTDNGSFIVLHYIFESTMKGDSTTEYTGAGEGADFGFQVMLGTTFSVGAQLSYRTIHYNKSNANGIERDVNIENATTIPMVMLGLTF